ncbi:MAG: 2-dehydropantoate 2-reductase [Armatimonadota bacterium]|nr:2-dehydropantoate 2-reductase [Armatimonadota bacterium]MDR5697207.1 2-dehydropantoate 2-reductase [Armatimonadota bacterium]
MNVLVYGAGALGSLIGGYMAASGHRVTLMCRREHADAIRQDGLELVGPYGGIRSRPLPVTRLSDVPYAPDVVFLTVRGYQTEAAAADLADGVGDSVRVVAMQNGVGHEQTLAGRLGAGRVVAGAATIGASLVSPGRVVRHNRGGIGVAPWQGAEVGDIARMLAASGLRTRAYRRGVDLKWSKLLLNLVANATSAILDMSAAEIYRDPVAFAIERRMLREALSVMRTVGARVVNLPAYPTRLLPSVIAMPSPLARALLAPRAGAGRGSKMPSLWYDVHQTARESEVVYLNGAVSRIAREVGMAAPVNEALTAVLLELLAGGRRREAFWRNPLALAQRIGISDTI